VPRTGFRTNEASGKKRVCKPNEHASPNPTYAPTDANKRKRACLAPLTTDLGADLTGVAERLREAAAPGTSEEVTTPLRRLWESATSIARAWSQSPIGYHSRVYYADFESPPAGARFSKEWGFMEMFSNETRGDWHEYTFEEVVDAVKDRADSPDLAAARHAAAAARNTLDNVKIEVDSILTIALEQQSDPLLESMKEQARTVAIAGTEQQFQQAVIPSGQFMSHDMQAMGEGLRVAPHLAVQSEILAIEAPFKALDELANVAGRAGDHISRRNRTRNAPAQTEGTRVFIGHGGSLLWRELKDFLQDRLTLPWDEFNRVPVAGVPNITRLAEMLDTAAIAFLVMAAEDERADGALVARQNVIHEAGLFQGRLGFTRAIVLLEDGCEEFSNIAGLGQIRFPKGRIATAFEDVRRVLEREGIIESR
jgi:predicted nucleotide-binding protein